MKAQAWLSSQAISNVLDAAFGGKMLSYGELFPEPTAPKPLKESPEQIKSICAAKGLKPPTKFLE